MGLAGLFLLVTTGLGALDEVLRGVSVISADSFCWLQAILDLHDLLNRLFQ